MASSRHVTSFLQMMRIERGASENTLENYRRDLTLLETFLTHHQKRLENCQAPDLRAFVKAQVDQGFSPRTSARRLSCLKQFFKFIYAERIRNDDPSAALDAPKQGRPLPKYLTEAEVEQLLNEARTDTSAKGFRMVAMLELLYACGLRVSEMLSLPLSAFKTQSDMLMVRGKGDKERLVPLAAKAFQAVEIYMSCRSDFLKKGQESPWLFPSKRAKDGHVSRQIFDTDLRDLALRAGIQKKVSAHILRHSFASHMLDHDVDLRALQQMLGHADIATTTIYTHLIGDREKQLVLNKHPLAKRFNPDED